MRWLDGCNKSLQSLPLIWIPSTLNTGFAARTKEKERDRKRERVKERKSEILYLCV